MPQRNHRFHWVSGGLDSEEVNLKYLAECPVPGPCTSRDSRAQLERAGYVVRHKLSDADASRERARGLRPRACPLLHRRLAKRLAASKGGAPKRVAAKIGSSQKRMSVRETRLAALRLGASNPKVMGKWVCLTAPERAALWSRHKQMIVAANERLRCEQKATKESGRLCSTDPDVGIFWWHDGDGNRNLSDNNRLGLLSAAAIGGLVTKLYSYTCPENLPAGVMWCDARDLMKLEEHAELQQRMWPPALVADVARLRGMAKEIRENATFVWFVDLDTHWVMSAKAACSQLPAAAFEHVVATMQGPQVSRAGRIAVLKKGMMGFLRRPFDYQFAGTPFRVTKRSPLLPSLLELLEAELAGPAPEDRNYFVMMDLLAQRVAELGFLGAYMDPNAFAPIPYTSRARCLKEAQLEHGITSTFVLGQSVGVNSHWQSGKGATTSMFERGSHDRVFAGSLWSQLTQMLETKMRVAPRVEVRPAATSQTPGAACIQDVVSSQSAARGQDAACSQGAATSSLRPSRRLRSKTFDPHADVRHPVPWSEAAPLHGTRAASFCSQLGRLSACGAWDACHIKQRCQLIQQCGDGTYGKVYAGKYIGESEKVAVKVSTATRLHQSISPTEVALLSRAQSHPNIVGLIDYFYSPFFVVIVMEFLQASLIDAMRRQASGDGLQPDVARHVTRSVARAVAHLHSRQILHRDLHPGNILLSFSSCLQPGHRPTVFDIARVAVTDFGQSCDAHGDKPMVARSAMVAASMVRPPECFFGDLNRCRYDAPVDVWAIGMDFIFMIKGAAFFPTLNSARAFHAFITSVLGPIDRQLSNTLSWRSDCAGPALRSGLNLGLQPAAGGANVIDHLSILQYDPAKRPSATEVDRKLAARVIIPRPRQSSDDDAVTNILNDG